MVQRNSQNKFSLLLDSLYGSMLVKYEKIWSNFEI
jgi:hypothetical protein